MICRNQTLFLQNSIRFCRNQFRFPRTTRPLLRNQKTLLQNEIWFRENVQTLHRKENSFRRNDFSFLQNFIMFCCCQNHLVVDGDDDHAEATTAERIERSRTPRWSHRSPGCTISGSEPSLCSTPRCQAVAKATSDRRRRSDIHGSTSESDTYPASPSTAEAQPVRG